MPWAVAVSGLRPDEDITFFVTASEVLRSHMVSPIEFSRVTELTEAIKPLIPQKYTHFPKHYVVVAAWEESKPIGIAIVRLEESLRCGELEWIEVLPSHQNRGIATQMLRFLEDILRKENCSYYFCIYTVQDSSNYLEEIFANEEWSKPTLYLVRCKFKTHTFQPPWLGKQYSLTEDFTEFFWRDVNESEKQKLKFQRERNVFHRNLYPFLQEEKIDYASSLGLRYKDEIVGWVITHRISSDTLRYSVLYIEQRWQMSGAGIKLLNDSILLHKQGTIPWTLFEVNVPETEPSWLRFVQRHLVPYAEEVTYQRHALKSLL